MHSFDLVTDRNGIFYITLPISTAADGSGIAEGILLVSVPHSTAAVTVASHWDPLGLEDVDDEIRRLIPTRIDFKHQVDTPQDAAGHVKAAIIGHSRAFCISEGKLCLGTSQRIFFWEFDAPRTRHFHVQIIGA